MREKEGEHFPRFVFRLYIYRCVFGFVASLLFEDGEFEPRQSRYWAYIRPRLGPGPIYSGDIWWKIFSNSVDGKKNISYKYMYISFTQKIYICNSKIYGALSHIDRLRESCT